MSDSLAGMTRSIESTRLLQLIFSAAGLSLFGAGGMTACGGNVTIDSGVGGSTSTNTGGGGSAGTTNTGGLITTTTGPGGAGGCIAAVSNEQLGVPSDGPCANMYVVEKLCFPAPKPSATCDSTYSDGCIGAAYSCGLQQGGGVLCGGAVVENGECCYPVGGDCPVGRPFFVHGEARVSSAIARTDWLQTPSLERETPSHGPGSSATLSPDTSSLDAASRAALADFWTREALAEHASVASFSRFLLQLLGTSAPANLVREAQQAISDEIDHATIGFALASAYSGAVVGPSALDATGSLDDCADRIGIAVSLAAEGCIAETVSAVQVAVARDSASDPAVVRALTIIAEQEQQHAALAWRALRWMLDRGDPAVHAAVARVFANPEAHVGIGPVPASNGALEALRAHGCLPANERRSLAADTLARIVAPAGRALLSATGVPCSQAVTLQG